MEQTFSPSLAPSRPTPQTDLRATLKRWLTNIRTRRQLALLDERLLADAGISQSERDAEMNKAFWQ